MAKIAPKGKKVTGTKKKDKITWVSTKPWKKALTVKAGAGNDIINFKKSKYKNTIYGDAGNDKIYGGKSVDKIYGGVGNDILYGYAGNDIIKAGAGNDVIDGGAGNDKIYGESGTNTLTGGAGNDSIYGGSGKDYIYAGAGNDYVFGGAGDDVIYGTSGNNVLNGGDGKDTIFSGTGNNTINGGAGHDYIDVSKGKNTIIIDDLEYSETIAGLSENDIIKINMAKYLADDPYLFMYPDSYDSKTKNLIITNNYNYKTLTIKDYTNEARNCLIKFGDSEAVRISEFLADNDMYLYNDQINNLSYITQNGYYYTLGGNDTITTVGGSDEYVCLYTGDGDDSITDIFGYCTYVYGEDGDDYIETREASNLGPNLSGGAGNDTIITHGIGTCIFGDEGDDFISGAYMMRGGDGNDTITSHEGTTSSSYNNSKIYGDAGDDEIHIKDGHTIPVYYRFNYSGNEGNDTIYDNITGERNITFEYGGGSPLGSEFLDSVKYYTDNSDLIISYINNETQEYSNTIRFVGFMNLDETTQNNLKYYYYDGNWCTATVKSYINNNGYENNSIGQAPLRIAKRTDVQDLTQSVAGWLSSNGGSVDDIMTPENNVADITTLIAQFDNANHINA